jgi:hypothetical protein
MYAYTYVMKCSFFIQKALLMKVSQLEVNISWMIFEVLTLVKIMIIVFWDVTLKKLYQNSA